MSEKTCKICNGTKNLDLFSRSYNVKYSKYYYKNCLICTNKKNLENKHNLKGGKKCNRCGEAKNLDEFKSKFNKFCIICNYINDNKLDSEDKKELKKLSKLEKEIINDKVVKFLDKVDKQRGYITEMDAFYLISYGVDVFGPKDYHKVDIEDELIITWNNLKEWRDLKIDKKTLF